MGEGFLAIFELHTLTMTETATNLRLPEWVSDFKIQAVIIALLSIVLYCNTFTHESAFDDSMVIIRNEYVLEGTPGLYDIFTRDSYDSYYQQFNSGNQLEGGRYRPLSIASFAIEQQLFGPIPTDQVDSIAHHDLSYNKASDYEQKIVREMHIRHVLQVLWFALSMIVLLYFLRSIVLRSNPVIAFLAVVIFTIHPIHTEVVANIKSRDEIFSLLFLCLTFIFAFRYRERKKIWLQGVALVSLFAAFLSKEYAIVMIVLLPLAFYMFNGDTVIKSLLATLPYLLVVGLYVFIRLQIVHPESQGTKHEISNDAYAYATPSQAVATKIATSMNYLKLLLIPDPLVCDYSYNTLHYKDFSNPLVWLAIIAWVALIAGFFYFFRKQKALSFAIAFYLAFLLLVGNIFFNIGAPMGERLIYHSSAGFAIAVAFLLYYIAGKIPAEKMRAPALAAMMALLVVLCGFKTADRNQYWKNDYTLFFHDLKVAPDNYLINGNAASAYLRVADAEKDTASKSADMRKAKDLFGKSLSLDKFFWGGYINRSYIYFMLNQPDSSIADLEVIKSLYPAFPKLATMYYNVGVAFYKGRNYPEALKSWQSALQIQPDYKSPEKAINILYSAHLLPGDSSATHP